MRCHAKKYRKRRCWSALSPSLTNSLSYIHFFRLCVGKGRNYKRERAASMSSLCLSSCTQCIASSACDLDDDGQALRGGVDRASQVPKLLLRAQPCDAPVREVMGDRTAPSILPHGNSEREHRVRWKVI